MARPKTTATAKVRLMGDSRVGRKRSGGLVFTRVRNVRRVRSFAAAPRRVKALPEFEEYFEQKFQVWYAKYRGTRPEFMVFDYLVNVLKYRELIDFKFQSSYAGGRQIRGGSVVDFEVMRLRMYWRVQGEYFHTDPAVVASDVMRKIGLSSKYKVVDIFANDLIFRKRETMEAAVRGVQIRHITGNSF